MSPLYRRIGHYEIRGEIGSGGMADVFMAEDVRSGETVALKIPRRDPDIRHAERQGAVLQQCLAREDPRVARVHEIGEDEGIAYVAMEYVAGEDLSERIARGALAPAEAIRVTLELCDLLAVALAFIPPLEGAPRRGIVHGDLKPRNVRLDREGRVRVLDFGIAKALSETRTRTRNDFGSLPYSSPERIESGKVDGHSDLWAVAVVLHEMLAGRPPFEAGTPRALEQQILAGARANRLTPDCPAPLAAVLAKALDRDLARRYPGAAALKADLECVMRQTPTVAEGERYAAGASPTNAAAASAAASESWFADERTRRTRLGEGADAAGPSSDESTRRTHAVPAESTQRTAPGTPAVAGAGAGTMRGPAAAVADAPTARPAAQGPAAPPAFPAVVPPTARTAIPATVSPRTARTAGPAALPPVVARARRRWVGWLRPLAILLVVGLALNEFLVADAAGDLGSRLNSYSRADANLLWSRFRGLKSRSVLRVGTVRLGWQVKDWFVARADDLTADWLSDTPTIRERGWQQAVALLQRAATAWSGDRRVAARLRYCEGQLARIDAEAARERGTPDARGKFNTARRVLEEAAGMRRNWPDPWLALARVEAIGFADVDRTTEALSQADRSGYRRGSRETATLADAHRLRAERTWASVRGLPDEERYLERIHDDGVSALELYDAVPAYGDVSRSLRRLHALLELVQERQMLLAIPADTPEGGSANPGAGTGATPDSLL